MITDRDIAVRGVAKGYGPDTPVRELMTDDVMCARDDEDVEDVASKMSEAQVRRLPVIDENRAAVRYRQPRRPQPRSRQDAPQGAGRRQRSPAASTSNKQYRLYFARSRKRRGNHSA